MFWYLIAGLYFSLPACLCVCAHACVCTCVPVVASVLFIIFWILKKHNWFPIIFYFIFFMFMERNTLYQARMFSLQSTISYNELSLLKNYGLWVWKERRERPLPSINWEIKNIIGRNDVVRNTNPMSLFTAIVRSLIIIVQAEAP